ncbi:MAG: tetratricopeptide repeat protein [Gammaproteobacteria bacterium]|nr:tetratricopeptide repeat protein [Gammaproteobacteria bacterium]
MNFRTSMALMALTLAATSGQAEAKELYERAWLEVRSPNFLVISSVNDKKTRTLAKELEDFRKIVSVFTTAAELEPRVPTVLFVFPGAFRDIGLADPIGGFFHQGMRANYAVVRSDGGGPLSHFIQHEYTHFVVRNQGGQAYPRWYDEGFAELLATVNLRDGKFDFGNASPGRLYDLNSGVWIKYARLIDDKQTTGLSRSEGAMYYAEAWALVHYLTWGRPGVSASPQLGAYLAARERGTAANTAFEEAFGVDLGELDGKVRRYISKARYRRGTLKRPFDARQVSMRKMAADEVAAALGNLCIVTGHHEAALPYVEAALRANPRNARALVDRADLYKFADAFQAAEPLYEQAIAVEPANDLHHLDFAEYWLDRVRTAEDGAARATFLGRAREELLAARKLNDSNPETLAVYGSTFLIDGQDPAAAVDALEQAQQLLPSQAQIKFMLASAYITAGRLRDARSLLAAVQAWEEGNGSEAARELLQKLEAGGSLDGVPEEEEPETAEEPE